MAEMTRTMAVGWRLAGMALWLIALLLVVHLPARAAGEQPAAGPAAGEAQLFFLPQPPRAIDLRSVGQSWIGPDHVRGGSLLMPASAAPPAGSVSQEPLPPRQTSGESIPLPDSTSPYRVHLDEEHVYWVRARLATQAPGQAWFVRVPSPNVDQVTLFLSRDGLHWTRADAGDLVLVASQQYRSLAPLFALPADLLGDPRQPLHLMVRVRHQGSFSAPVEVVDQDTVFYQRFTSALWLGAYFGLAGVLGVLALIRAMLLRNTALAAFAGFVLVVALAMAAHVGVAGLYLWPSLPRWNHWGKFVLPAFAGGVGLVALAFSLSLSKLQPRFSRSMMLAGALVCAFSLNLPWFDWPGPSHGINGILALLCGSVVASCVVAWRRGDPMARPLALAMGIALPGTLVTWSYAQGYLAASPAAWYALPLCMTIAMAVWYYGLAAHADRLNATRIRQAALVMQDPLTGLANARALESAIERMVGRCVEFRHDAAFVVVKFLNGPQVTLENGRSIVETALVKVAASLREIVRPVDMAARMGSFTYACAIEGPVSDEQLRTLATRIVAAGLALKADLPEQVCPDLAVWVLRTPAEGRTLGELYAAARPRFEGRDEQSPKRIFMHAPPSTAESPA